jgi:hypothetical protein
MSAERHRRLMELFDQACELGAEGVSGFLAGLHETDGDVSPTLAKMLEADRRSQLQLLEPPKPAPARSGCRSRRR